MSEFEWVRIAKLYAHCITIDLLVQVLIDYSVWLSISVCVNHSNHAVNNIQTYSIINFNMLQLCYYWLFNVRKVKQTLK